MVLDLFLKSYHVNPKFNIILAPYVFPHAHKNP
jgi:hypothetical protein